jgi:DNA-binding HxlR family transcriptional regulator
MALFDLLGRRWAMGVLWTICEQGPLGFNRLEALCETISPAVLSQRLKDLLAARLVERTVDGYAATELGRRIYGELVPLGETAKVWASVLER